MMKTKTFLLFLFAISCSLGVFAQGVDFAIRNQQVTNSGTKFEFDIFMGADQTGTFHSRGQIYIIYDTVSFGKNVVLSSNMTSSELNLLNETLVFSPTTPKYATINVVDNTFNIFALTWESNFSALPVSATFHTEVPDSLTPLYHIVMDIANPAGGNNVAFDLSKMFFPSQQFYFRPLGNPSPDPELPYNLISLPVEFLSFSAEKQSLKEVLLTWTTATELNNDYFVVEKQREGGSFEAIGQVKGAGTTQEVTHYDLTDRTSMARHNFYRLRQVDFDGSVSYSEVVEVTFDELDNGFTIYPSPAAEYTFIRANGDLTGDYNVQLMDVNGRILHKAILEQGAANNELKLDLSQLSEGMYFIRLQSAQGVVQSHQVMKVSQ